MRSLALTAVLLLAGSVVVPGCARSGAEPAPGATSNTPESTDHSEHAGHGAAPGGAAPHDAAYAMAFDFSPAPAAGRPSRITYTPQTAAGVPVGGLAESHERLTHLVVVSRDLGHFDHVHPEHDEPNGAFTIDYAFPGAGEYVLFADFTPEGSAHAQVFSHPVTVGGPAASVRPLGAATSEATEGGLTVHLAPDGALRAGEDVTLSFSVTDARGPVRDLEPYLGAGGHVVVIPEGADGFLHVHPADGGGHGAGQAHADHGDGAHGAAADPAAYGPELRFATAFPEAGRYKLWLQVQRAGRVHTFPFVLDVAAAS